MVNPEENKVVVAKKGKDLGQISVERMLSQVNDFAVIENNTLTDQQKAFAMETILVTERALQLKKLKWEDIDIKGCQLPQQIKAMARLELSFAENELYLDIRNNGKTGLKDIKIMKQYQGTEKEIIKWLKNDWKVSRPFKKDVILIGEEVITKEDFGTGFDRIVEHKRVDGSRNDLKTITGAYVIAYIDIPDGGKTRTIQVFAKIDKDRLDRAYNASPSNEKAVWKKDSMLMCLKTASWVLYDKVLKPFIMIPIEIQKDWELSNTKMDFAKENAIEEVKVIVDEKTGSKQLDFDSLKEGAKKVIDVEVTEIPDHDTNTGEIIEEKSEEQILAEFAKSQENKGGPDANGTPLNGENGPHKDDEPF